MHANHFLLVGQLRKITQTNQGNLQLILSEAGGPIKLSAAAEVRDQKLKALLLAPNGFQPGDTVSLSGKLVFDESTGQNIAVVNAIDGACRITKGKGAVAQPASAPQATPTQTPPQPTPRGSHPAPTADDVDLDEDIPF